MTNITLGEYLFHRIKQIGISSIFGVPGDFNLFLLDHINSVKGLNWIGTCNELNAAYAADAYARVRRLPGVLITTYGVGELSAINGIAGAYAENSPVIHIVGTTSRPLFEKKLLLHHTLPGPKQTLPDYSVYMKISEPVSCSHAFLDDIRTAPSKIDKVITDVMENNLPGYIYVPTDMVNTLTDSKLLNSSLKVSWNSNDVELENKLIDEIINALLKAKNPSIISDLLVYRYKLENDLLDFVNYSHIPTYTTMLGRGTFDETHQDFVGVYNGILSRSGISSAIESSDLVLMLGPLQSDSNTGGFTVNIDPSVLISLHPYQITIFGTTYNNVHFVPLFKKIVSKLLSFKSSSFNYSSKAEIIKKSLVSYENLPSSTFQKEALSKGLLSQTDLYTALRESKFFQPNDVVLAEVGTVQFGLPDVPFNTATTYLSQVYFSSIGGMLPGTLGAGIAVKDESIFNTISKHFSPNRVVLFEGDGSAQLTIQELGTIARFELNPVIFILNNSGFSIERAIHGPKEKYNDICPNWKWKNLLDTFGAKKDQVNTYSASSKEQLLSVLEKINSKEFSSTSKIEFVELLMHEYDYPWRLQQQIEIMGPKQSQWAAEYAKAHPSAS